MRPAESLFRLNHSHWIVERLGISHPVFDDPSTLYKGPAWAERWHATIMKHGRANHPLALHIRPLVRKHYFESKYLGDTYLAAQRQEGILHGQSFALSRTKETLAEIAMEPGKTDFQEMFSLISARMETTKAEGGSASIHHQPV
jgi:hypothetical protein